MKTILSSAFVILATFTLVTIPPRATAQGVWNNALSFDGTNDFVVVTNFGSAVPTNEVTVEFWQRVQQVKVQATFSLEPDEPANRFLATLPWGPDGVVYWDFGNINADGRLSYLPQAPVIGTWQHYALVAKAGATGYMKIYRNGLLEASKAGAGSPCFAIRDLNLGKLPAGYFQGALDEFRVWNKGRSGEEIARDMWRPMTGAEPNLVACWHFDEASGTIAHDSTANHFDGVLVGGPLWTGSTIPAQPPSLGQIPNQTITQGTSTGPISLPVTDADTPLANLLIIAMPENPVLVPDSPSALVVRRGDQPTLEVIPDPGYSGQTKINVRVTDGTYTAGTSFVVTVEPQPELRITEFSQPAPAQFRLQFLDTGTGSTNYVVESTPDLSSPTQWTSLTNVSIRRLGNSSFEADIPNPPPGGIAFFDVRGFPSPVTQVNFNSTSFQVDEGAGTVSLVLLFNKPFLGTVRYSLSGPDTNSVENLTGSLAVYGSTASIPLTTLDDENIGTLKYLILTLEAAAGYSVGASGSYRLTILEDDALWQGVLRLTNNLATSRLTQVIYTNGTTKTNLAYVPLSMENSIDFALRITHAGGTSKGTLIGDGLGFFPAQEWPAALAFSASSFAADVENIQFPPETTLLNTPITLSLRLAADNTDARTNVGPKRVEGNATLVLRSGLPHLQTTNFGTFLLLKPPVRPSTNQVQLTTTAP